MDSKVVLALMFLAGWMFVGVVIDIDPEPPPLPKIENPF